MGWCTQRCKKYCFYITSLVIVLIGICIVTIWGIVFNSILRSELALSNTSRGFEMWRETPIPMYFDLYLYNWTNSKEVIDSKWKIKPHFQQCGPYVYMEKHIRVNMQWHANNTITFHNKRIWNFQPHLSNGSLSDPIDNINVIATTIAYTVRNRGYLIQKPVDFLLNHMEKTLVLRRTAEQWLFKGFDDEIINLVVNLNISGLHIPFDKFGWFYARNESETYDGLFNMYTGQSDMNELGIMERWNRENVSHYYEGECAYINGSSGELWPPIGAAPTVHVFSPDICSTLEITYATDVDVEGVIGRQYEANADTFDNGTRLPHFRCFSVGESMPSGVRNVSKCKFGAPAFISYPHFYDADPIYLEHIDGLSPDPDEHKFTMSLEPTTGVPLNVRAQMQINILLQPIKNIKMFKDVPKVLIPMLWFRQTARLPPDMAGDIKMLLILPDLGNYTGYGLVGLGTFFTLICIYLSLKGAWNSRYPPLLASQTSLDDGK